MTDFIREVDEEVRQEKFRRAISRYWYLIALAVVLVLGGVGAWKAIDAYRTGKAETASGAYLAALDLARDGKSDDAIAALRQVASDGTPGYQLLARFRLAGETGLKDPAAAAKLFDDVAADPAVDPALQAIARLRASLLLVDTLPYAELKTRLDPLADANSPVRNAAREMLALAALKATRLEDAAHALDAIESDPAASASLRQRAAVLHGLIPPAAPPAPASAPPASPAPAPAAELPAK